MTSFEQLIYNKFIAITRSKQGKPFKLRKDFINFEKEPAYIHIKKLAVFFNKHSNINIDDFFAAPFEIYEEPGEVYLDYYTTRAAIRSYSLARKKKEDLSPEKLHDEIKESLRFIGMFCLQNNISIKDYIFHNTGCTLSWMQHYRERKINIYSLLEMGDLTTSISSVPADELALFFDNAHNLLAAYKSRYYNSSATVSLVREGTKRVSMFLEAQQRNKQ